MITSSSKFFFLFWILALFADLSADSLVLKQNLRQAKQGDYIVTAQGKTYTLLHVFAKTEEALTIEEISVPISRYTLPNGAWKDWIAQGAPNYTSWVMYSIDLSTGQIKKFYSFSQSGWHELSSIDNFLSTLLNLELVLIPDQERKKVGRSSKEIWQPNLVFEGRKIPGVEFQAWMTRWPNDGTELACKSIEIYVPLESAKYPSYFPYWLQISGMVGKAKVRIVDSGTQMTSPKPPLP